MWQLPRGPPPLSVTLALSHDNVLFRSEVIHCQVEVVENLVLNFHVLGSQILRVRGPKFLTQFLKLQSLLNMWESLVSVCHVTSELRVRVENRKKHQQQNNALSTLLQSNGLSTLLQNNALSTAAIKISLSITGNDVLSQ